MRIVQRINRRISWERWRLRKAALAANRRFRAYRDVVWLLGDGRSGTTWVGDLINADGRRRNLFEPIHPFDEPGARAAGLKPHAYLRPGEDCVSARPFIESVLSGRYISQRADRENRVRLYRGLLIKDIFANLLARWALTFSPHVKPVLLLRHPFAVAASKRRARRMRWMTDPKDFLSQPKLVEDHLAPYLDLIDFAGEDYIARQVLIWAVINSAPLRQFSRGEIHVLFYEDVYLNPADALQNVFDFIGAGASEARLARALALHERPSAMATRKATIVNGESPVASWKNDLTRKQIEAGLVILRRFGLDKIYTDDILPDPGGLGAIMQQSAQDNRAGQGGRARRSR